MAKRFTKEEIIRRVGEAIGPCSGTLITVGPDGCPRARALEDHNPYEGSTFWFATHAHTRKIAEIEGHVAVRIWTHAQPFSKNQRPNAAISGAT